VFAQTTLFADGCSACPLIFLGGVECTIWSPYPRLGFHQVSGGSERGMAMSVRSFGSRMLGVRCAARTRII